MERIPQNEPLRRMVEGEGGHESRNEMRTSGSAW